jgi:hypothetical protein
MDVLLRCGDVGRSVIELFKVGRGEDCVAILNGGQQERGIRNERKGWGADWGVLCGLWSTIGVGEMVGDEWLG